MKIKGSSKSWLKSSENFKHHIKHKSINYLTNSAICFDVIPLW